MKYSKGTGYSLSGLASLGNVLWSGGARVMDGRDKEGDARVTYWCSDKEAVSALA